MGRSEEGALTTAHGPVSKDREPTCTELTSFQITQLQLSRKARNL